MVFGGIVYYICFDLCLQLYFDRIYEIQKRTAIAVMMIPAVLMYLLNDYIKIYVTEIAYIDRVAKYWMWFLIGMFFVEFEDNIKRALKDRPF